MLPIGASAAAADADTAMGFDTSVKARGGHRSYIFHSAVYSRLINTARNLHERPFISSSKYEFLFALPTRSA
jgi:hypothetical protein